MAIWIISNRTEYYKIGQKTYTLCMYLHIHVNNTSIHTYIHTQVCFLLQYVVTWLYLEVMLSRVSQRRYYWNFGPIILCCEALSYILDNIIYIPALYPQDTISTAHCPPRHNNQKYLQNWQISLGRKTENYFINEGVHFCHVNNVVKWSLWLLEVMLDLLWLSKMLKCNRSTPHPPTLLSL